MVITSSDELILVVHNCDFVSRRKLDSSDIFIFLIFILYFLTRSIFMIIEPFAEEIELGLSLRFF